MPFDLPWPRTDFAEGYSRRGFNKIKIGDTSERVIELIGKPKVVVRWAPVNRRVYPDLVMIDVRVEDKRIVAISDPNNCLPPEVDLGMSIEDAREMLGKAEKVIGVNEYVAWHYSMEGDRGLGFYKMRTIVLDRTGTHVIEKRMGVPTAYSEANGSVIPSETDHRFRFNPIGVSDAIRSGGKE